MPATTVRTLSLLPLALALMLAGCGLAETAATGTAVAQGEIDAAKQAKAQEAKVQQQLDQAQQAAAQQRQDAEQQAQ